MNMSNRTYCRVINQISRLKHSDSHWSVQVKKKTPSRRALEHFDDFYKTVYGKNWPSIRQGLLAPHKYVAVVNNYSNSEQTITRLESTGALNIRTLFNLEKGYIIERLNASATIDTTRKQTTKTIEAASKQQQLLFHKSEIQTAKDSNVHCNSVTESLKHAEYDLTRIINPVSNLEFSTALHEFVPTTKLKGKEDWISETQHYRYYDNSTPFQVTIEKEYDLHFPEYLNVLCYEKSNYTAFNSPRRGNTTALDYYLLDGGSLLPVLALGLKPGDRVLDLCSAPGGKALIAIQTLYPDVVVCNDSEASRVKRIYKVLGQYLYDFEEKWLKTGKVKITQQDARFISTDCVHFNRILVDIPCTNDRLSITENDNNWFKGTRTRERLQLPEAQAAILVNALRLVKKGGSVVYSTCSLSPIQNDGVVNMALKQIWEETDIKIIVKDLSPALEPTKCCFDFADQSLLRFGHLVIPYAPQNYGPMYFCKLVRV